MDKKEIALSTGTVPPARIAELGLVTGSCVISTSILGDALATLRNMSVGGELKQDTELLRMSTEKAIERLGEKACEKGADGVYAIQFMAPQVAGGAAEVVAVGTAYKFNDT